MGIDQPAYSYFWGLVFALLFYYGFPVWWWRYGLQKALELIIACVLAVIALQEILSVSGMIQVDNLGAAVVTGLFVAVPVRAVAGLWVARRDAEWRSRIVLRRNARRAASSPDN